MGEPYYMGDNVPLGFTASDKTGNITPNAVNISFLKPNNTVTNPVPASINGNEVSYSVPVSVTDVDGKYKAYFVITLPNGLIRTHKIEFEVVHNP